MERSVKGFTLVELMMVVALIAVLGAIALGMYAPIREKTSCEQVVTSVYSVMELLIEDVSEDGVGPAAASYAGAHTINGQSHQFMQGVQISFSGAGTAASPWIVNGQRSDMTCPENDGVYTLRQTDQEGAW